MESLNQTKSETGQTESLLDILKANIGQTNKK